MKKFTGVMPALITPLNADETINVCTLQKQITYLLDKGAYGFYIGGATGEGIALRREAREELASEAIKAANGKAPCIVHIASAVFSEAIELAKQAEKAGADAISAIPPLFYSYDNNDVYNYYKAIAESVNIPVMIYYTPAAGFDVSADLAARLFKIDNITAIKWTSPKYYEMIRLKDMTNGEMNIINGPDEMLICGLAAGADGGIGSTYNVILPQIKSVYENFISGNIAAAQKAQTEANRVIDILAKNNIPPVIKMVLEENGLYVGNAAFPLKRFDAEQKKTVLSALDAVGFKM